MEYMKAVFILVEHYIQVLRFQALLLQSEAVMGTKNSSQMKENLNVILQDLEPISLKQMDGVQLLDRTDTKFIFHSSRVWELLGYAQEYYQILQIGNERAFHYNTTYFDTVDFLFFRQHTC